ncbi:TolC family protein [Thiospirochaeta perfilievii]|uniref:TolC family protein n=1 Tax=Thiospirochaeta perfilievii TaxID=252967 RepID=A0A5C1QA73_9SPIO|nr:TolC family protein [Thiospirochaeta perfilievii]QEN03554.1 TolC family protein [Thiospirochaeta perfilievii]
MKIISLIAFVLCISPFLFSKDIISIVDILNNASKNHSSWINLEKNRENVKLNTVLLKESFLPDFSFGDGQTPIYTYGSQSEKYYHNISLITQMNWWLPTDGTLSISALDTISYAQTDDDNVISQSPVLSFSYTQPTWLSGKFIEPSLYSKIHRLQLDIPLNEDRIKYLIDRNNLIYDLIKDLLDIDNKKREVQLLEMNFKIADDELEVFKSNRDKGLVSGTDYWKKQLERDTIQDSLWEKKSNLELIVSRFLNNYGYSSKKDSLNMPEFPELPTIPLNDNPTPSLLMMLQKIKLEKAELQSTVYRKQNASYLTTSFSIAPKYGIRNDPSSFSDSLNFGTEDSYIDYSLSVTFKLSSKNIREQNTQGKIVELDYDTAKKEYEDTDRTEKLELQLLSDNYKILKDRKERLFSSINYAKTLFDGEKKLLGIGRTTPLLVQQAKFNYESRKNDLKNIENDLYLLNLKMIASKGYDLMILLK